MSTSAAYQLTSLRPAGRGRVHKLIRSDGRVEAADNVRKFFHTVENVDTPERLLAVIARIAGDNAAVIRGAAASPRQPLIRQLANVRDRGDEGFIDEPRAWLALDIDKLELPPLTDWRSDLAGVLEHVVGLLPEAFHDAQIVYQLTASHGLEFDGLKRWTGSYSDTVRLRLWVLLDRPIDAKTAEAWTAAMSGQLGLDGAICRTVQLTYTARPRTEAGTDPLAPFIARGLAVVGLRDGLDDRVVVPEDIEAEARWSRAEGRSAGCASHASAEAAILAIGRPTAPGGRPEIRSHMLAAVGHVARAEWNARRSPTAEAVAAAVRREVLAHREVIEPILTAHGRQWAEVANYIGDDLARYTTWLIAGGPPIAAPPAPLAPYIPAPTADREASIAAHGATIRNWAAHNIPGLQAIKAVARAYDSEMPNATGKMRIRRRIRDQFGLDYLPASRVTESTPISRVLLSGAAGVGKTAACVGRDDKPGILHSAGGLVSAVLEPDHGMAAQAAADYEGNAPPEAPPSVIVRGRNAPDPDRPGATMCRLGAVAGRLAAAGVSVRDALCEKCPFRDDCSYLRQEAQLLEMVADPAGVVIFAPHDFAWLPLPGHVAPDLVIFDERPRDYGVELVEVTPAELAAPLKFIATMSSPRAGNDRQADALVNHLQHIQPLKVALRDAARDRPDAMLAALRERGINRDWIAAAIAGLEDFKDNSAAHAMGNAILSHRRARRDPAGLQVELDAVLDAQDLKNIRALSELFDSVLREIDAPRDASVGFFVEAGGNVVASRLKSLRGRIGQRAFLHLDATADADMAQRLFGELDVQHHAVERSPAERGDRVEQVIGRQFHTRGLKGDYQGAWAADYAAQNAAIMASLKPGSLLVAPKQALAALEDRIPPTVATAHFGALRGRNDWEGCDEIVLLRADQPAPADVERIARAFAATEPRPFKNLGKAKYPTEQRGIRTRSGPAHAVEVAHHPDPWGDRVLRQIRDAEMIQAIDRLRLIFRTRPVNIRVLASVALDLTVDVISSFAEFAAGGSRVERALRDAKVVPLERLEAARLLPGIWSYPDAAKRDLALFGQSLNKGLYLDFAQIRNLVRVAYAVPAAPGGRKRVHEAIVAGSATEARALLERLTGALEHFEVIEVLVERPAPAPAVDIPAPVRPPKPRRPAYVFRGKVEERVDLSYIIPFRAKG